METIKFLIIVFGFGTMACMGLIIWSLEKIIKLLKEIRDG